MLIVNNLENMLSKKLYKQEIYLPGFRSGLLMTFLALLCLNSTGTAQVEDLQSRVDSFKKVHSEAYELKYLNIAERDLGVIDDTYPAWKDKFMLKGKEKSLNNLGSKSYPKFYFNIYAYETLKDRQYALKDWMEKFLEGESIRPGREMRTYDYASPTIILINDTEIIIANYKCSDFSEDNFEFWLDELEKYFGADNTMVIEVLCGGPLKWTENPPDPRTTRGLF